MTTSDWRAAFEAARTLACADPMRDELDPYIIVGGVPVCDDCEHDKASHSIADPNWDLCYGMGNCGNCIKCADHCARCGEVLNDDYALAEVTMADRSHAIGVVHADCMRDGDTIA